MVVEATHYLVQIVKDFFFLRHMGDGLVIGLTTIRVCGLSSFVVLICESV
jgi:hypothetical protein